MSSKEKEWSGELSEELWVQITEEAYPGRLTTVRLWMVTMMTLLF